MPRLIADAMFNGDRLSVDRIRQGKVLGRGIRLHRRHGAREGVVAFLD
jgi:hypothetical protein